MGSVVISVGIGAQRPDEGAPEERYRETLSAWRRASYCFDRHEVPATWLVAGHLFAPAGQPESAGGQDGTPADRRVADDPGSPEQGSESTASGDGRRGSPDGRADGGPASEGRRENERRRDDGRANDPQGASGGSGDEPNASPCVRPDRAADPSRFADDRATDHARSARSAPDLVESIRRSRVTHEIGCQPFARPDFGDASQDDAAAAVRASIDAAAELGIEADRLRAFAFPDGSVGHRDVLAAYGLACYREPGSASDEPTASVRGLASLVGRRLGTGPPLVEPETDEYGLVAMPTSMTLAPLAGRARTIARRLGGDPVAALAKRGVDRAAASDGLLHLSVRPRDLRSETDFERLDAVLSHVADRRAETDLRVETMGQIARRLGDYAAMPTTPIR